MNEAGEAVQNAAAEIPAEVSARFETADKLSDEDRKTVIAIATKALAPFQPKPDPPKPDSPKPDSPKPARKAKP